MKRTYFPGITNIVVVTDPAEIRTISNDSMLLMESAMRMQENVIADIRLGTVVACVAWILHFLNLKNHQELVLYSSTAV